MRRSLAARTRRTCELRLKFSGHGTSFHFPFRLSFGSTRQARLMGNWKSNWSIFWRYEKSHSSKMHLWVTIEIQRSCNEFPLSFSFTTRFDRENISRSVEKRLSIFLELCSFGQPIVHYFENWNPTEGNYERTGRNKSREISQTVYSEEAHSR